ncbi:UDP-N-acetylmuramate--L-alanine ligase [Iodidimonas muriae]|uniref:UDP-N-acetylmuramate--L-alanine ligase n=1 Tax=Iodidimonas muriae TaxID=261467 RepID=A0ABQ2LC76_9PROT|nr:UDP-N-acetylmuramate--L-alanine ligase [Iodidimonas muriae]GER06803.1 UDP-N-acetylmuramate--L-alanine ligase [Kordiimonadales bacterium JCM 17843]GGO09924.1 UDP-N-acetylmuramate--L-alanine ligase [Iodidimonas muriae]
MKSIPFDIGVIHFVGIGGIGMSGIAEVMHNLGYQVQGSDIAVTPNVERLRGLGIVVSIGHHADNLGGAEVLVISSAIRPDNAELLEARDRQIPVVRRAEMLAELMRLKWCVSVAGTHGKTTTTSLCAAVLDAGNFDPTVINGGIINAYGTNARLGEGKWMVVEADESDGTFVKLPATLAVVTNIDPEHLDFYGDFDTERAAFRQFIENIPFYGAAILCIDHPEVQSLMAGIVDRRIVTYGFSKQADIRAVDLEFSKGGADFAVEVMDRHSGEARRIEGLRLPMPGRHNVQNALAALCVGLEMGLDDKHLGAALLGFRGVKRRFSLVAEVGGVTIVDDYGHHPVEIAAVLGAAREAYDGRVIAVVQPHRYSRLKNLFEDFCTCFNQADHVIVTPVYEAGETPIEGAMADDLARGLKAHGHRSVTLIDDEAALAQAVASVAEPGDLVVCLGAGSITRWAHNLPQSLAPLLKDRGST